MEKTSQPVVLHVITGLNTGGAESMLARLLDGPSRFRPVVASLTGDGTIGTRLRKCGIQVVDLGMHRGVPSLTALCRLVRLIRQVRPAVIQTWLYHADLIGLMAARLATRAPVVWNLRCSDMDLSRYGRLTRIVLGVLVRLSGCPQAVIANSEAGKAFHAGLGYRPRAWHVLPNGIDVSMFQPDPVARRRWRERLGIAEQAVVVGMAARRDPMKDHEALLQAAARLDEEVVFLLVGTGVDAEDQTLASLAAASGKVVHLLGRNEDMPGFMAALDVAVLASKFGEGFPNVVGEAMSAGVPVVASNVGDAAHIIGDTGAIVTPNDVDDLAAAISLLTKDPDRRARLGRAARDRIIAHFEMSAIAARYDALWASVAERGD